MDIRWQCQLRPIFFLFIVVLRCEEPRRCFSWRLRDARKNTHFTVPIFLKHNSQIVCLPKVRSAVEACVWIEESVFFVRSVGGWSLPCHAGHTAGCHHGTFPFCLLFGPAAGDARHRRRASSELLTAGAPGCDGRNAPLTPNWWCGWSLIHPGEPNRCEGRTGPPSFSSKDTETRRAHSVPAHSILLLFFIHYLERCVKNSFLGENQALTSTLGIINAFLGGKWGRFNLAN